jgi:hypothetical protein
MPRDYCVVSPLLRQTYRLAVVCHITDANAIQAELKTLFEENGFARFSLLCEQSSPMFVKLTALLESTIAERAALVRIVNRLGTMASVRRLQWETVPNRLR